MQFFGCSVLNGRVTTLGFVFVILVCHCWTVNGRQNDIMFSQEFKDTTNGWNTWSPEKGTVTSFGVCKTGYGLCGADETKRHWFFSAPSAVMGDRSGAFSGSLVLTMGHVFHNSLDKAPMDFPTLTSEANGRNSVADVIMTSQHKKISLSAVNVLNRGKIGTYWGKVQAYSIPLVPSSFAFTNGSSLPVSQNNLIEVLQSITSLRVRGSYFQGAEMAVLQKITWVEGVNDWYVKTNPTNQKPREVPSITPNSCQTGDVYTLHSAYLVNPTTIQFTNIPIICSSATITFDVKGDFLQSIHMANDWLIVIDQFGYVLGSIFNDASPPDEGFPQQRNYVAKSSLTLSADIMSRLTATNFITLSLAIDLPRAPQNRMATYAIDAARITYRASACEVFKTSGILPADPRSSLSSKLAVVPNIFAANSDVSFALYLYGPVSSSRITTSASLSILRTDGSGYDNFINFSSKNVPRDFSEPFAVTINLDELWKYRFSNNSLVLNIQVEAKIDANPVQKFWELRMIAASSACYIRSLNLKPWCNPIINFSLLQKRAHPSACGMTSCFKTSLNAASSFDLNNEFSLDIGSSFASATLPSIAPIKLISFTDAAKPSGMMVLTLVYYSTDVGTILRLSACNSTCNGSGKLDGSFFSFAHNGKLLPRCQLQSSVEQTVCYQPRCFPKEVCATSIYPTSKKPLLTSILIDPVSFLKGSSWTGSYEIWMEVTNRGTKSSLTPKTNTISQEAPNMEVLAVSISFPVGNSSP